MVTQPREYQEAKGRGRTEKRAEPKKIPMHNGGGSIALTWAAAAVMTSGNVFLVRSWRNLGDVHAACPPVCLTIGSHED